MQFNNIIGYNTGMNMKNILKLAITTALAAILVATVPAAYAGGYTNVCGNPLPSSGNYYNPTPAHLCPGGQSNTVCNTSTGSCSASGTVIRLVCDGFHQECRQGISGFKSIDEGVNTSKSVFGACNETVQVDAFNVNCRNGDGSWKTECSNGSAMVGYLVYHNTCDATPTPNVCADVNARFEVKLKGQQPYLTQSGTFNANDIETLKFTSQKGKYPNISDYSGVTVVNGPTGKKTINGTVPLQSWPYAFTSAGEYWIVTGPVAEQWCSMVKIVVTAQQVTPTPTPTVTVTVTATTTPTPIVTKRETGFDTASILIGGTLGMISGAGVLFYNKAFIAKLMTRFMHTA